MKGGGGKQEEYDLGSGTICLAGPNKMVVANSVLIRAFWSADGSLTGLLLRLSCQSEQLALLKELGILPSTVEAEKGPQLRAFFRMKSEHLAEQVISELGDDTSLSKLFLAEDRFPPILNLLHYELDRLEG